ncbi:MAG: molybdenum cofactor guanylyltransferase [Bacteroidia bacterium]
MDQQIKPLGVVLCGGESRRMGIDKSLINYHGTTQRDHVKKLLSTFCAPVVLSLGTNADDSEEAFPDLPEYAGNGPLSGLLTLHYLFPEKSILLIGCDYPLILRSQLRALIPEDASLFDAVCYISGASLRPEPILAWYSSVFCEYIRTQFETNGSNSLRNFLEQASIHTLKMDKPIHLTSVDHPEDVTRVRQIIQNGFDTFV